jgi:hypothetical protein
MSDHNLGEDAYRAYVANVPFGSDCLPWDNLPPAVRTVWERIAAAVTLRLCMSNIMGASAKPDPIPEPQSAQIAPICLTSSEVAAIRQILRGYAATGSQDEVSAALWGILQRYDAALKAGT